MKEIDNYREYISLKAEIEADNSKMDRFKESFAEGLKKNSENIDNSLFNPVKECWFKRFLKKLNNVCG